jgi:hypothetical protein
VDAIYVLPEPANPVPTDTTFLSIELMYFD